MSILEEFLPDLKKIKIFKSKYGYKYMRKHKKEVVVTLLAGILIIIFLNLINAYINETIEVVTSANITDQPPFFFGPIPNFSWAQAGSLPNAFDLDDYFLDDSGYEPNYSHSSVQNVSIVIDSSNVVSFFSLDNLIGVRTVTFYADDGKNSSSSNLVYLFIGTDNESPQWYNPMKDKNKVYQNVNLGFTTLWTDNVELKDYYFWISQGGSTFTSSWISFGRCSKYFKLYLSNKCSSRTNS
jgi:hypothetical protein